MIPVIEKLDEKMNTLSSFTLQIRAEMENNYVKQRDFRYEIMKLNSDDYRVWWLFTFKFTKD